jgi:hypothetical protein
MFIPATILRADIQVFEHFTIDRILWDPTQLFNAQANAEVNPSDFQLGSICIDCPFVEDPDMIVDGEIGFSESVGLTFSFTGNGISDFINASGVNWHNLLITAQLSNIAPNLYTCHGNAFASCGFDFNPSTSTLKILYFDPVPEPASWTLLLTVLGAMYLWRRRLRRA